jgi:hypothetical protein
MPARDVEMSGATRYPDTAKRKTPMQNVEITFTPDGEIRFLVSEGTTSLLTPEAVVRRASHVEPVSRPLRILFHGLRTVFGETGRISDLTRSWPVRWRVNLAPIGGPVLFGYWMDRQDAIQAEINYLNANFI